MRERKVDFLVIGSGVAGLSFALKVARHGSVLMITKDQLEESNTNYAQGGIAAVWDQNTDSFSKHVADTIDAGANLNDPEVVNLVVNEGPSRIEELIALGTRFDKSRGKSYDLAMEGGHTAKRILHHKDVTGREIVRALREKVIAHPKIEVLEHHFAVDLITQHHFGKKVTRSNSDIECYGTYVFNERTRETFTVLAKRTVMSTGGVGVAYSSTTNPLIATGDGIAMAYRAKALVQDMEFIQFHPTALYQPGQSPAFLVSEAVRGFGAKLRNHKDEEFMVRYDNRGSLAPRDIVARAIDSEMKIHGLDHVYLDCTHLNMKSFKAHFPTIYGKCVEIGINPAFHYIPVTPSAHYCCGGIAVDQHAKTSIKHLYAIGECSKTGLHGANRLASNSLLEAVVFADRAAKSVLEELESVNFKENVPQWDTSGTAAPEELILITQSLKEVQGIMSAYVGIVRSDLRLKRALDRLKIIYEETETLYEKTTISRKLCEVRNIINVSYLIIKAAAERKQSLGLHFTLDESARTEG